MTAHVSHMTSIPPTFHFDVPIEHKNYSHNLATPPHHSSEQHQVEVTHTYKQTDNGYIPSEVRSYLFILSVSICCRDDRRSISIFSNGDSNES